MKLMISQPMNGKTTEQIREEREELVKKLEAEGHEVIDTIFAKHTPDTRTASLWYLSKAIEAMSKLEGVVFMRGWNDARGCRIEHEIAVRYGLFVMEEA